MPDADGGAERFRGPFSLELCFFGLLDLAFLPLFEFPDRNRRRQKRREIHTVRFGSFRTHA